MLCVIASNQSQCVTTSRGQEYIEVLAEDYCREPCAFVDIMLEVHAWPINTADIGHRDSGVKSMIGKLSPTMNMIPDSVIRR